MGAGKPVIATRVEGAEDVIKDGENGLLVPIGDADALAGSLIMLLKDDKKRTQFGIQAKVLIESDYTLEHMCQKYERLFLRYRRVEGGA